MSTVGKGEVAALAAGDAMTHTSSAYMGVLDAEEPSSESLAIQPFQEAPSSVRPSSSRDAAAPPTCAALAKEPCGAKHLLTLRRKRPRLQDGHVPQKGSEVGGMANGKRSRWDQTLPEVPSQGEVPVRQQEPPQDDPNTERGVVQQRSEDEESQRLRRELGDATFFLHVHQKELHTQELEIKRLQADIEFKKKELKSWELMWNGGIGDNNEVRPGKAAQHAAEVVQWQEKISFIEQELRAQKDHHIRDLQLHRARQERAMACGECRDLEHRMAITLG